MTKYEFFQFKQNIVTKIVYTSHRRYHHKTIELAQQHMLTKTVTDLATPQNITL